ncbi:MAG: acyltransferase [Chlamydiales bacterium]
MVLIKGPTLISILLLLFIIYALPVLFYRIHNHCIRLCEGGSRLDLPLYSPWWASHQFQGVFNAFPSLEAFLRLIPGVYSFWLRTWGSKVGRRVHWTPRVEIIDRSLIEVGDDVIFGHKVIIVSHAITKKKNGIIRLYVKRVRIGSGVFIGAGSKLGPGTVIAPNQIVPFETLLTINKRI